MKLGDVKDRLISTESPSLSNVEGSVITLSYS